MQSSRSPAVQPLSLGPLHHLALNHALESVPQRSMKRTMKSPQKRPKSRFCAYAIMATFLHSTRHNQVGSPEKSLEYGHICGAKRTCDELSVLLVSGAVPGTCGKWPILRKAASLLSGNLTRTPGPDLLVGPFQGDSLSVSCNQCTFG